MTRGRKPQTPEQKRLKGETRPCRTTLAAVVDFPKVEEMPAPPDWLTNDDAVEMWEDLCQRLITSGVMTEVDVYMLAHLCHLHGELVDEARRRIKSTAADKARLQSMLAEFGLSPSSRSRVGPADGGRKGNKFAGNGKKNA